MVTGSPTVAIPINGQYVKVTIDTGADRTIMSRDLWELCREDRATLQPVRTTLRGANGEKLKIVGTDVLTFQFNKIEVNHTVIIVDDVKGLCLLGSDMMYGRISVVKGTTLVVEHDGVREDFPLQVMYPRMRSRVSKSTIIPPRTAKLVQCKVEGLTRPQLVSTRHDGEFLLSNDNDPDDPLQIANSLTTLDRHDEFLCLYTNHGYEPLEVEAEQEVGELIPVKRVNGRYEEYEQHGNVYFLHDREAREKVLSGNDSTILPDPAGYELEEPKPDNPVDIESVEATGLNNKQYDHLKQILYRYKGVFSTGSGDFGCTPLMKFSIDTGDAEPRAAKYYPVPAAQQEPLRKLVRQMMDDNILETADSPWNSTLVIVPKPDGSIRWCVNLKGVNKLTVKNTCFPIGHQEESLIKLCNAKFYFVIDLSQAYHSIPMASDADKDKTAFTAELQQYRYRVAPFGARDLPSQFNKLMGKVMEGLTEHIFYYFDDMIGAFRDADTMLKVLEETLFRLINANLRVNFKKSHFCLTQLTPFKWLGSIIHENKLKPDANKVKAILDMPVPTTRKGMQRFLGSLGYHRRHLERISEQSAALHRACSKKNPYNIGPEEKKAFEDVKEALANAPALALPDISKPFILTTDASDIAIAGCLSQKEDDGEQESVVAYCSRVLTETERNGSSCEKEMLAIIFGLASFNYYLVNTHFTLRTDSKSLVFLKFTNRRSSKMWKAAENLAEFSFDIEHMSATRNNLMGTVDMISRAYGESKDIPKFSYKELRNPKYDLIQKPPTLPDRPVSWEEFEEHALPYLKELENQIGPLHPDDEAHLDQLFEENNDPQIFGVYTDIRTQIYEAERRDRFVKESGLILAIRSNGELTTELFAGAQSNDSEVQDIVRTKMKGRDLATAKDTEDYQVRNGVLCVRVFGRDGTPHWVVYIPKSIRQDVLDCHHGRREGPHLGSKKLYLRLKQLVYWPGMSNHIKNYCKDCPRCKYEAPITNPTAVLVREYHTSSPNEVVNIDIVGPYPTSSKQNQYVLTMEDDFSKFVRAVPLKHKDATSVARAFFNEWACAYGNPSFIRSDEGTDTDSALMQYLCMLYQIKKLRTAAYSPHANPVERFHRTLNQTLRTWLQCDDYRQWDQILPHTIQEYNRTPHTTTEYSAIRLFLGRDDQKQYAPPIPEDHPGLSRYEYLKTSAKAAAICNEIAAENRRRVRERQNKGKDPSKRPRFEVGQRVLIKNHTPDHKLSSRRDGPYYIIEVRTNTLHVARWLLEDQPPYRLHHQPKDMGQVEKRIVHMRDAIPWGDEIPEGSKWNRQFAKDLLKRVHVKATVDPNPVELAEENASKDLFSDVSTAPMANQNNNRQQPPAVRPLPAVAAAPVAPGTPRTPRAHPSPGSAVGSSEPSDIASNATPSTPRAIDGSNPSEGQSPDEWTTPKVTTTPETDVSTLANPSPESPDTPTIPRGIRPFDLDESASDTSGEVAPRPQGQGEDLREGRGPRGKDQPLIPPTPRGPIGRRKPRAPPPPIEPIIQQNPTLLPDPPRRSTRERRQRIIEGKATEAELDDYTTGKDSRIPGRKRL